MNRKVTVPPNIGTEWRRLGLPRELSIAFWAYIHNDLAANYEKLRVNRDQGGRGFKHKKVFKDKDGNAHLFVILVDDETSADHLIITDLQHIPR